MSESAVSFEVTELVFEKFGYKYDSEKSNESAFVFVNTGEPQREYIPQITLDAPDQIDQNGSPAYRETKIIDVIAYVHGFASAGEAIYLIRVTKQKLN